MICRTIFKIFFNLLVGRQLFEQDASMENSDAAFLESKLSCASQLNRSSKLFKTLDMNFISSLFPRCSFGSPCNLFLSGKGRKDWKASQKNIWIGGQDIEPMGGAPSEDVPFLAVKGGSRMRVSLFINRKWWGNRFFIGPLGSSGLIFICASARMGLCELFDPLIMSCVLATHASY